MTKITKFTLAILFTLAIISTTSSADWFDGFNNGNAVIKQYKKSLSKNKHIKKKSVLGIGDETFNVR